MPPLLPVLSMPSELFRAFQVSQAIAPRDCSLYEDMPAFRMRVSDEVRSDLLEPVRTRVSTQTIANLSLLLLSPTFRIQPFGSHPPTFGQAVMHHLHFPLPAALSFDHHPFKLLLFIILSTIFFISGVLFILGPLGHRTTSPACAC